MKRIKLTESQYNRLKLINEQSEEQSEAANSIFEEYDELEKKTNSIWTKVSFINIGDLYNEKDNLFNLSRQLSKLDSKKYQISDKQEAILASVEAGQGEDAMLDLDSKFDTRNNEVSMKIDTLDSLVDGLHDVAQKLHDDTDEVGGIENLFDDNSIQIG